MVVERTFKDGKLAILISRDVGTGWSTWEDYSPELKEFAAFDSGLVTLALSGASAEDAQEYIKSKIGDEHFYMGGWEDVKVEWVEQGRSFYIDEHVGAERIITSSNLTMTA